MTETLPSGTHVLMIAYPAMGHMLPMLSLADQLIARGCCVTYVTSLSAADDIRKLWPSQSDATSATLRLRLLGLGKAAVADGLGPVEGVWENVMELSNNSAFFVEFLVGNPFESIPDTVTGIETAWPAPAGAVVTAIATVSGEACLAAGLKTLILFDTNAYGLAEVNLWDHEELSAQEWRKVGKEQVEYHTLLKDGAACLSPAFHFSRGMKAGLTWAWRICERSHGVLVNSSEVLEPDQFSKVQDCFAGAGVPVTAVGPLFPRGAFHATTRALDDKVHSLLEAHGPGTTLYISFGSFLNPPIEHLALLADVLKEREQPFVWSLRDRDRVLRPGFEDEVAGFGVVVPWVDQKALLAHDGIGFVLSHMGWNTTLEACTMGKPICAWPLAFDQLYNSALLVGEYQLGVRFPFEAILASGPDAALDPASFKAALERTFADTSASSEIGLAAIERAREMGKQLRASLAPGGSGQVTLDRVAAYLHTPLAIPAVALEEPVPAPDRSAVRVSAT